MRLAGAVDAEVLLIHPANLGVRDLITDRCCRGFSGLPGVIGRRGDRQFLAAQPPATTAHRSPSDPPARSEPGTAPGHADRPAPKRVPVAHVAEPQIASSTTIEGDVCASAGNGVESHASTGSSRIAVLNCARPRVPFPSRMRPDSSSCSYALLGYIVADRRCGSRMIAHLLVGSPPRRPIAPGCNASRCPRVSKVHEEPVTHWIARRKLDCGQRRLRFVGSSTSGGGEARRVMVGE